MVVSDAVMSDDGDRAGRERRKRNIALAMIVLSYVVVGVTPRTVGRQHADGVALIAAPIAVKLAGVLGPLPKLLIQLGNALTPGKGFRDGPFTSEAQAQAHLSALLAADPNLADSLHVIPAVEVAA